MKQFMIVGTGLLAAVLLGGTVGCNKGESTTVTGEGGKKLTLTAPADTSVTQGETTSITVSIAREKFNDPVELTFSGLPEGVKIMENDMTISKDAKSAKFTLKAAPDAKPVENHIVSVMASGGGMKTSKENFKVTVKKASGPAAAADTTKKLTLKPPSDTSVKQGDTTTITTEITRDKFNDPVTLKFSGLPDGVKIMENDMTISKDATSAKYTLKAADDAKVVENHPVTVTATGGGLTQDGTFKLTVKKK